LFSVISTFFLPKKKNMSGES